MHYIIYKTNSNDTLEQAVENRRCILFKITNDITTSDFSTILNDYGIITDRKSSNINLVTDIMLTNAASYTRHRVHCVMKNDKGEPVVFGNYEYDYGTDKHILKILNNEIPYDKYILLYTSELVKVKIDKPVNFEVTKLNDNEISVTTEVTEFVKFNWTGYEDALFRAMKSITENVNNWILDPRPVIFTIA